MKGRKICIYIRGELLPMFNNFKDIAEKLNISIFEIILNKKYRDHKVVEAEIQKAEDIMEQEEIFTRINIRLRDSLIFDKCASGSLNLLNRGCSKSDIISHFRDELKLLDLSSLNTKSKSIMRKKIKAQLSNFKKAKTSDIKPYAVEKIRDYTYETI